MPLRKIYTSQGGTEVRTLSALREQENVNLLELNKNPHKGDHNLPPHPDIYEEKNAYYRLMA